MTEMVNKIKDEEPVGFLSGALIIRELKGKINAINQYPYDTGNLDDLYLNSIGSDELRMEVMERGESHRREALLV